ncbi:MAG: YbhB/YbcL family Raf kinase inhibitor-like protein [Fimbriimonadaceae bacterium]|nr:YbhB/YbcL family Raf kinase inhibitor-like protein [Fimbriimonadaceae bacterium]
MRATVAALLLGALAGCAPEPTARPSLPLIEVLGWPPGGRLPAAWTCRGGSQRPAARWRFERPSAAFALILEDPDAPGGTWYHWVAWNLTTPALRGGAEPEPEQPAMREGTNSWGRSGYGSPCPPSGEHRYVLHVWALSERLELPASTTGPALREALRRVAVGHGSLLGRVAADP